ncbi:MAG: hypothetical protein DRQ49_09855 [Gammaproteobacteria bacterium]|nr:MAG: hypothetical protein DRQ41_11935 [Gammaproteobacteria bacterium]RKZ39986.1 MAG: hypothetical protein DRQ49_09855 [Gammaproteobacteria bacterium]RKZ73605.1 MAG: hypothetical protein DRQ57_13850 [Gammaproteobacteria bacterium]
MWDRFISFINALIIHALLLAVLFFTIEPLKKPKPPPKPEQFIQAVTVDENQWLAAIQKRERIAQHQALRAQQDELSRKKRQLDKLRLQQEQQRLAKLKQRQLLEAAALEELKRQQAEKARLRQEALERKRFAEALAREKEAKRKAAKKRQAAEQARLEAEKKRQAKAKAQEQARLAKAQRKADQKALIQEVIGNIKYQVRAQWIRPPGYYRGLSCVIEIRLKRGGVVKQVNIVNSSGNLIFDNSAKLAVRKASPLPVPNEVFDTFKHFTFTFKPKY